MRPNDSVKSKRRLLEKLTGLVGELEIAGWPIGFTVLASVILGSTFLVHRAVEWIRR